MPSNKWEETLDEILELRDWLVSNPPRQPWGVDEEQQSKNLEENKQALTNAVRELVAEAKPERPGVNKGTNDPLENKIEGFALGIDDYQANLLKAIGDTDE